MGSIVGGIVSGAGSIFGANKAADAQRDAARASQQATNRALDIEKQIYDQTRADYAPYRDVGTQALPALLSYGMNSPDLARSQSFVNALGQLGTQIPMGNFGSGQFNVGNFGSGQIGLGAFAPNNMPSATVGQAFTPANINVDFAEIQNDPLYQFAKQEALEQNARNLSKGGLNSSVRQQADADTAMRTALSARDRIYQRDSDNAARAWAAQVANYGRDSDIYGRQYQQQGDVYDRSRDRSLLDYQTGVDNYNRARQDALLGYQTNVDNYMRNRDNALLGYQTGVDNYNRAYGALTDQASLRNQLGNQLFGRLSALTGIGQSAAGQMANVGSNYATNTANALTSGAAQSGLFNSMAGNTMGGLYENLGQGAGMMLSQPQTVNALANWFGPSPTGTNYDPNWH